MDPSPDPSIPIAALIIFIFLLILLSAVFKASETAIMASNKSKVKAITKEDDKKAKRLNEMLDDPDKSLSAIQLIINFITVLASAALAANVSGCISAMFYSLGIPYQAHVSIILIAVILSFVALALGNFYPQKLALRHPEKTALFFVNFIAAFSVILKPFVFFTQKTVDMLLRITRQNSDADGDEFFEDDVMSMLEVGKETGVLREEGQKMINSIFAFDDIMAHEIMTPRTDVFTIDVDDSIEEYIEELMELRYSRIPVYENDSDNIIGILNIKDFLIKARETGFENVDLRSILRKPYFVPETKKIDDLFFDLQSTKKHIAILIDEYGGFSGIVTMEDLIEEVMGDITDEYDEEESDIEQLDENTYMISGFMSLSDLNEELGINLESDNIETVGGFLIDILGEIPEDGDDEELVIEHDDMVFKIESVKEKRVEKVKLYTPPKEEQNGKSIAEKEGQ